MEDGLTAGAAKVDITPAVGTELCGHYVPDRRSVGIHSNLYAKTLVFDDGKNVAALVACDLAGITSKIATSTRARITELTGIDGKNVMISCTHTHSGPGSMPWLMVGKSDESYQNQLEKKIAGAVYLATRSMKKVSIGLGVGSMNISASRRVKWPDGTIRYDWLDPNVPPIEPFDNELCVLTLREMNRKAFGVVVNAACHTATMAGEVLNLISSDFPGVATTLIERAKGEGAIAMFFNGAYGDTHPRKDLIPGYNYYSDIKGDELTTTLGTILGASALKISETTPAYSDVSVQVLSGIIKAPLERLPPKEDLQDGAKLDQMLDQVMIPQRSRIPWRKIMSDWYEHLLELYENGTHFEAYEDLEVQVIRLGDTYIVGLPGEVFSQIGLEIKAQARKLGLGKVLVFALSNGNPGYIPAEDDYSVAPIGKRGYELERSYMFYGRPLVGKGTSRLMIEAAIRLISILAAR